MAWITPVTTWKSTDFINYTDYNRIKGKVAYIKKYHDEDMMKDAQNRAIYAWNQRADKPFTERPDWTKW